MKYRYGAANSGVAGILQCACQYVSRHNSICGNAVVSIPTPSSSGSALVRLHPAWDGSGGHVMAVSGRVTWHVRVQLRASSLPSDVCIMMVIIPG